MNKVNEKRIIEVLSYVALVLGTISLTSCPTTNSKYWTESEKPYSYNADIYTLNKKQENLKLLTSLTDGKISTDTKAYLKLNFYRQGSEFTGSVLEKNTEKYTFDIESNKCSLREPETSYGKWSRNILTLAPKESESTVTPIPEFTRATAIIECDLSDPDNNEVLSKNADGKYELNVKVNIKEQIDGEMPFSFKDYIFSSEYGPLNEEKPTPPDPIGPDIPEDALLIDANNLGAYNSFKEALNAEIIMKYQTSDQTLTDEDIAAIKTYLNSISDEQVKQKDALKGLILFNPNPENGVYAYDIDSNFLGYAKTFIYSNAAKDGVFFSSGKTAKEINDSFAYYLEEYYCKKDGVVNRDNINLILNYIKSTIGIKTYRDDMTNNTIPGLSTPANYPDAIMIGSTVLNIRAPRMFTEKELKIYADSDFTDDEEIMKSTFKTAMNRIYGESVADSIISKDVLDSILTDETILSAVSNTSSSSPAYFVRKEDGYAILLEVITKETTLTATVDGKTETIVKKYNSVTVSKVLSETDTISIDYKNLETKKTTETTSEYESRITEALIAKFKTEEALKAIGTVDETKEYIVTFNKNESGTYLSATVTVPIKTSDTPSGDEPSNDNPSPEYAPSNPDEIEGSKEEVESSESAAILPEIEDPEKGTPKEEEPIKEDPNKQIVNQDPEDSTPTVGKEELVEEANESADLVAEEEN